jgi:hypothetical protein
MTTSSPRSISSYGVGLSTGLLVASPTAMTLLRDEWKDRVSSGLCTSLVSPRFSPPYLPPNISMFSSIVWDFGDPRPRFRHTDLGLLSRQRLSLLVSRVVSVVTSAMLYLLNAKALSDFIVLNGVRELRNGWFSCFIYWSNSYSYVSEGLCMSPYGHIVDMLWLGASATQRYNTNRPLLWICGWKDLVSGGQSGK